jgi:hypothetical protein
MRLRGAELRSLIRLAFARDPFRSEGAMQRGIAIVFR